MSKVIKIKDEELINIVKKFKINPHIDNEITNKDPNIDLNNFIYYYKNNNIENKYKYEVKSLINIDCSFQELVNIFSCFDNFK